MSAGQPAPPPPFRPSCIVCVSDCDAHGLFTSCHHFLCARCVAKYPQGVCPRCQKPCRTMPLNAPAIAERISADGLRAVSAAQQTAEFQRRQDGIALARLRELVGMFNEKHRQEAAKAAALQAQVDQLGRENGGLKEALRQAQAQLQRSPPPQQQQQQQQRPRGFGQHGMSPPPNMGYDAPPPQHPQHQAPATPLGHTNQGLQQQWQRAPSVGSAQSLFSAKRPRAPPTPTGPPGGGDRFMLATPAMTLRAGGGGGGGGGTPAMHDMLQRRPPQPQTCGGGGGIPTTIATGGKTAALPPLRSMLPAAPSTREEHPRIPSACGESAPFAVPGAR